MLLARLAVGTPWQGKGIGADLLKDAMRRTQQAAEIGGIRAFAVHAKDAPARRFYEHFDFVPSPTDPMHLFVLIKDFAPPDRRVSFEAFPSRFLERAEPSG